MKLITIKQVSGILNVKESTLYEWIRMDKLPSYRLGGLIRIEEGELYEWIRNQKVSNTGKELKMPKIRKNADIDSIVTKAIESFNEKSYDNPEKGNQTKSVSNERST